MWWDITSSWFILRLFNIIYENRLWWQKVLFIKLLNGSKNLYEEFIETKTEVNIRHYFTLESRSKRFYFWNLFCKKLYFISCFENGSEYWETSFYVPDYVYIWSGNFYLCRWFVGYYFCIWLMMLTARETDAICHLSVASRLL